MSNEPERDDYVPKWKQRSNARYMIAIRCAAAAYVLYMGYTALKKALSGEDEISLTVAILIAVAFAVAAGGILFYSWRQWSKLKKEEAEDNARLAIAREAEKACESDEDDYDSQEDEETEDTEIDDSASI